MSLLDIELRQNPGYRRMSRPNSGSWLYSHLTQTSSQNITRTRQQDDTGDVLYSIRQLDHPELQIDESNVRARRASLTSLVNWESNEYIFSSTPDGLGFYIRDRTEPSIVVMSGTDDGDLTVKSLTATQRTGGVPALLITRAVASSQLVLQVETDTAEVAAELWAFNEGPSLQLFASPTATDGTAAYILNSAAGHDVMSLHHEVASDDPNEAGVVSFSDNNGDGYVKLRFQYPNRLQLIDVGATAEEPVNIGWPRLQDVIKTADESVNNSTAFQSDNELQFDIKASETWYVELMAYAQPNTATMDLKHQWSGPAGFSYLGGAQGSFGAPPTALSGGTYTVDMPGTSSYPITWRGWVTAAGTAGTVHWQWAQNTLENSAPGVTVKKNSWLRAKRTTPAT